MVEILLRHSGPLLSDNNSEDTVLTPTSNQQKVGQPDGFTNKQNLSIFIDMMR